MPLRPVHRVARNDGKQRLEQHRVAARRQRRHQAGSVLAGSGDEDPQQRPGLKADRKSVGSGKSVSVRVDLGGRRIIKQTTHHHVRPLLPILPHPLSLPPPTPPTTPFLPHPPPL